MTMAGRLRTPVEPKLPSEPYRARIVDSIDGWNDANSKRGGRCLGIS